MSQRPCTVHALELSLTGKPSSSTWQLLGLSPASYLLQWCNQDSLDHLKHQGAGFRLWHTQCREIHSFTCTADQLAHVILAENQLLPEQRIAFWTVVDSLTDAADLASEAGVLLQGASNSVPLVFPFLAQPALLRSAEHLVGMLVRQHCPRHASFGPLHQCCS